MPDQSSRLLLPYLQSGQAQKHVTVNESLLRLDALVQLSVVSATIAAQPGSPADGDLYILPAGKTGANWAAMANGALAYWRDGAWEQVTPNEGFLAYVKDVDQILAYSGSAWLNLAANLRASATDKILGRVSAGAGAIEEIAFSDSAQALCDDASFQDMCATLGSWRVLGRGGAGWSVTGTTTETTLASVSVPAGAMGPNGVLRVTSLWKYTNSANSKTLKVQMGGVNFINVTPTTTNSFQAITTIANRNAANSQVAPSSSAAADGAMGTEGANPTTGAVDTAAAQTLSFKATLANTGETITLESYLVELAYGA
ncbi:MAG TPA: hypothetical protein DHW63_09990 [Hyphomonadaceae bacterium]|nr:hypothetical protein [Hyphomonadaceae bacterium]